MKLDGVSQSTGVERVVELTPDSGGVLFAFSDRRIVHTTERIVLAAEPLMAILTDRPEGQKTLVGMSGKESRAMKVEIRKNEVLLILGRKDAAVGLDDLMDALAAIPSA